jgi:hypothetical protein
MNNESSNTQNKINKPDRAYEELQYDEEKLKKKSISDLNKSTDVSHSSTAVLKPNQQEKKEMKKNEQNANASQQCPMINHERDKIEGKHPDQISKEYAKENKEMNKCPHGDTSTENCNCHMNCDCKRTANCKDNRIMKDVKDERYDNENRKIEGYLKSDTTKQEEDGVWDKTKNVISGGIDKAKDFFSKF